MITGLHWVLPTVPATHTCLCTLAVPGAHRGSAGPASKQQHPADTDVNGGGISTQIYTTHVGFTIFLSSQKTNSSWRSSHGKPACCKADRGAAAAQAASAGMKASMCTFSPRVLTQPPATRPLPRPAPSQEKRPVDPFNTTLLPRHPAARLPSQKATASWLCSACGGA